jgi:hypothetical protein
MPPGAFRLLSSVWGGKIPVVTSISPVGGPPGGGTNVTITGSNFTGAAGAKVDGVALTAFVVVNDTTITGTTGAGMTADKFLDVTVGPSLPLVEAFCTISLDWFQTPDYPGNGVAWPGTASAGTSGTHSNLASSAVAGAAINGHIPVHLAGGTASGGADTLDNYITPGQFSGAIVFDCTAAPPDNGPGLRPINAQLMCMAPSAFMGVAYENVGGVTPSVSLWMLSSFVGYVEQTIACPLATLNLFQFKYNGANLISRLNGGLWSAPSAVVPGFNGTNLNTQSWRFGSPGYTNQNPTADIPEGFLTKSFLSDAAFNTYLAHVRTKYAAPF